MPRWSASNPAPYMPNAAGKNGSARVKLQRKYMDALLADFEQHGEAAVKIFRMEDPSGYVRCIASLMPKELQVETFMSDTTDEQLDAMIEALRSQVIEARAPMKLIEVKAKNPNAS